MTDAPARPKVSLLCLNGQHETCPSHVDRGPDSTTCGCLDLIHAVIPGSHGRQMLTVSDFLTSPSAIRRAKEAQERLDNPEHLIDRIRPSPPSDDGVVRFEESAPIRGLDNPPVELTPAEAKTVTAAHLDYHPQRALEACRQILEDRLREARR